MIVKQLWKKSQLRITVVSSSDGFQVGSKNHGFNFSGRKSRHGAHLSFQQFSTRYQLKNIKDWLIFLLQVYRKKDKFRVYQVFVLMKSWKISKTLLRSTFWAAILWMKNGGTMNSATRAKLSIGQILQNRPPF